MTFLLMLVSLAGCGGTYRYYSYKSRAEEALRKKDFETAKDLYAIIYQQEKAAQKQDKEKICWAFYRLGVINELLGEKVLAKGYYWGDSLEEGFYAGQNQIEWFAEAGWSWLDQGNPSRSLSEILELEKKLRPARRKVALKKKKKIKAVTMPLAPVRSQIQNPLPGDKPVRVFNRSLTPPPPSFPEPFRVFY
jgi:hypothetical protein